MSSQPKRKSQANDPGRFSVRFQNRELGKRLRDASVETHLTVSQIIAAILEPNLDRFVRTHRAKITRLRPGPKLRLY